MNLKKILTSVALASLLFATTANACPKSCDSSASYHQGESTAVTKVIRAVSKTGITAAQTKKIAEGLAAYEAKTEEIKKMVIFPVDSFVNDEFDEKRFIDEMSAKYIEAVAARAALFKYVFAVLDVEQRRIFKREYAAPMIRDLLE